ncbi:MAG: regulatory protein RecX [Candidatus Gracilibacteria bacterium]|jgi:SOS response regulatory protein OraA/RecX
MNNNTDKYSPRKSQENLYSKLLEYAIVIACKKRYTVIGMREKLEQYCRKVTSEVISEEVSSTALSGNFDSHLLAVNSESKFPCRLVSDTPSEITDVCQNASEENASTVITRDPEINSGRQQFDENVAIEKIISRLIELKYLDDELFAKDFIADRIKFHPRGKFLIQHELLKKGIPKDIIQEAFGENFCEEDSAISVLKSRYVKWQKFSPQDQKRKAFMYLASKGFSPDSIYKAVECCYNQPR